MNYSNWRVIYLKKMGRPNINYLFRTKITLFKLKKINNLRVKQPGK